MPPHFQVRKVYDAKPMEGAEFIGDIDWVEVHAKGMNEGIWDTEPVMAEEEDVVISHRSPTKRGKEVGDSELKKKRQRRGVHEDVSFFCLCPISPSLTGRFPFQADQYADDDEANAYSTPKKSRGGRSNNVTPAKRVKAQRTANAISKAARQTSKRRKFNGKNGPTIGFVYFHTSLFRSYS